MLMLMFMRMVEYNHVDVVDGMLLLLLLLWSGVTWCGMMTRVGREE
jgi:hypothetical protein